MGVGIGGCNRVGFGVVWEMWKVKCGALWSVRPRCAVWGCGGGEWEVDGVGGLLGGEGLNRWSCEVLLRYRATEDIPIVCSYIEVPHKHIESYGESYGEVLKAWEVFKTVAIYMHFKPKNAFQIFPV